MQQLVDFIDNILTIPILDIVLAICIIALFKVLSGSISYWIIRLFRIGVKHKREAHKSAFYAPLKLFVSILGIYLAILLLQDKLLISEETMVIINKAFIIISIIIFARGFAQSFKPGSTIVNNILAKMDKKQTDSSINFILKIIRFFIYAIAVFLIITQLGINLNGLVAGLGVTGIIITLAAQDTAKNLFGGLMIFIDKPFVVGDWIQFSTYEGTVEDITFRSTRIRTFENSVVNVPNSILSDESINNWSRMVKRRFKTTLCLELDTPLEKVERLTARIQEMLLNRDEIIDDSVIVKFNAIVDNGIQLLIYSFTNSVDYASFLEETEKINYGIMRILEEEHVSLAYDSKTVYVKN